MNVLYDRILALCKEKGISGSRMCLDLGLSKSTMSDMKAGRTKGVSMATAQKIASYFDVSVGYLLGEDTAVSAATDEKSHVQVAEKLLAMLKDDEFVEMFDDFHHLDAKKRKLVLDLVHGLTEV
jgi:transcriptional regulator with XRE-family HTH domain